MIEAFLYNFGHCLVCISKRWIDSVGSFQIFGALHLVTSIVEGFA